MSEVVEMVDVGDDCVGAEDGLFISSVEGELSLEDAAADESPSPELSLESPPQESGSVGAFMRSCFLPEQRACIECSSGIPIRQFLKQHSPASMGWY
jgi:hypothetical protein